MIALSSRNLGTNMLETNRLDHKHPMDRPTAVQGERAPPTPVPISHERRVTVRWSGADKSRHCYDNAIYRKRTTVGSYR